ncbi:MAG: PASTA domain-containing protein, partial [Erysipelotrichaceae bacterium]
ITKATAKNLDNRYKNVDEMIKDLNECLLPNHANDKKIEFLPAVSDLEKTMVMNAVPTSESKSRKNILNVIIGLLLIILSTVGVGVILFLTGMFNPMSKMVKIPNVVNLSYDEAKTKLQEQGLVVSNTVRRVMDDKILKDYVINVTPGVGKEVEQGSLVQLVVSDGLWYVVGDYTNRDIEEVRTEIANSGSKIIIRIENSINPDLKPGTIVRQEGLNKDDKINPNQQYELVLYVAANPNFIVPNVIGKDVDLAVQQITNLGGKVKKVQLSTEGLSEDEIKNIKNNIVIKMDPESGNKYTQTSDNEIKLYYY